MIPAPLNIANTTTINVMPTLAVLFFILAAGCAMPLQAAGTTDQQTSPKTAIGIMPHRGMSMEQVTQHFGKPESSVAAVGTPPISRWHYDGFIVYFENNRVINSLMTTGSPD